ncbi:uncharacterized protein LOC123557980 [Mercenaria mercenaria]|uniref:uncharacterized protein LOC123557980 n=1 Tax=Mercenaria mercenaria TaxID=6596 RepID=UPI00234FB585|nr:uncharacterized protein LOC123557980 [Mercenaria mercenaria]
MACPEERKNKNNAFNYSKELTTSSIKGNIKSEQSLDAANEIDFKNDSHVSSITKSTVVKIENQDEETFNSFIIDYENDSAPLKQIPATGEPLSKSIEVQTDEAFFKIANAKTKQKQKAKRPTSGYKKNKPSCKKSPKVKTSYPRASVYPYVLEQAKRLSERPFPIPSILYFSTTKTKSSSANCVPERIVNLEGINEMENKAAPHTTSTEPIIVHIEKQEDGKLVDSFILKENDKEHLKQSQVANSNSDKSFHEHNISSICENRNLTSFEEYENYPNAELREERSKNKRKFSDSFVIPENCKNDPKLVADAVAVKLRQMERCTGVRNESVATLSDSFKLSETKSDQKVEVKTESVETDEVKSGPVETGVANEPVDTTDVKAEAMETEDITTDLTEALKQSEQECSVRKPEEIPEVMSDLTENEQKETIKIKSEPIEENDFGVKSIDIMKGNLHPEKNSMKDPTNHTQEKLDTMKMGESIDKSISIITQTPQQVKGDGCTFESQCEENQSNIPTVVTELDSSQKKLNIKCNLYKTTQVNAEKFLSQLKIFLTQQLIETLTFELENRLCSPNLSERRNVTLYQGLTDLKRMLTDKFRVFFLREINRLLYKWEKSISVITNDEKFEIVNKLSADLESKLNHQITTQLETDTVRTALEIAESAFLNGKMDQRAIRGNKLQAKLQPPQALINGACGQTQHLVNQRSDTGVSQTHITGTQVKVFTDEIHERMKQKTIKGKSTTHKGVKRKCTKQKPVEQKIATSLHTYGCILCEAPTKGKSASNYSSSATVTTHSTLTRLRPRRVKVKDKEIEEQTCDKRNDSKNMLKTLELMKVWTVPKTPVASSCKNKQQKLVDSKQK